MKDTDTLSEAVSRLVEEIDQAIDIDREMRESRIINLILDEAKNLADVALEELATSDPSDTKRLIYLQAVVFRARFIDKTLCQARERGIEAAARLKDLGVNDIGG